MLVTDRALAGGDDALVRAVEEAVTGGADAVQLREKGMPPGELLSLARRLREATRGRALLLVNGPLEVAIESQADGVHLPEDAVPVGRPRDGFLLGRSVHSLEAAKRAVEEGADYLVAGPVYETPSHPGARLAGLALIEAVAPLGPPVLAIGGLTAERVEDVVRAGAGVAVISAVLAAADRRAAAEALRRALDAAWAAVGAARR
jgi:thiamine-phosphate pyrophosphorylase